MRAATAPPAHLVSMHAVSNCDDVLYVPRFLADAQAIQAELMTEFDWREEWITMFGRRVRVPRLCSWHGDDGVLYRYSHADHRAEGWSRRAGSLRDELHDRLGIRFNFVLANLYRDGDDAMGWHADDERELGEHPCVASLSFGASRRFDLRARDGSGRRASLVLEPGSLLLMWGSSQRNWQHALPRTTQIVAARLNLTFRIVETV